MMNILKMILALDSSDARRQMQALGIDVDDLSKKLKSADSQLVKTLNQSRNAARQQARMVQEMKKMQNMMAAGFSSSSGINIAAFTNKFAAIQASADLIGSAVKYNIEQAGQFEQSLARLSSITGATGEKLDFFSNRAIELGRTTTQTATQVAQAFTTIGQKAPQLLETSQALTDVTDSAIILAQASGIDVNEAASALTNVMNQFGIAAAGTNGIIDLLAAGARYGAGDINYLSEALTQCGSVAKSQNISLQETIAALEQLAQGGFQPGQSGRMLKNMIIFLETKQNADDLKPSIVGLQKAFENLSKTDWGTQQMKNVFGRENIAAAEYLKNHVKEMGDMMERFGNVSGMALKQSNINTNTFQGSVVKLQSAWEGLNLTINQSNGFLKDMIDFATSAINKITDLISKARQTKDLENLGSKKNNEWYGTTSGMDERHQKRADQFKAAYSAAKTDEERKKVLKIYEADAIREKNRANALTAESQKLQKENKALREQMKQGATTDVGVFGSYDQLDRRVKENERRIGEIRYTQNSALNYQKYVRESSNPIEQNVQINHGGGDDGSGKKGRSKTPEKTIWEKYDEALKAYEISMASIRKREEEYNKLGIQDAEESEKIKIELLKDQQSETDSLLNKLKDFDLVSLMTNRPDAFNMMDQLREQSASYEEDLSNYKSYKDKKKKEYEDAQKMVKDHYDKMTETVKRNNYFGEEYKIDFADLLKQNGMDQNTTQTDSNLVEKILGIEDGSQRLPALEQFGNNLKRQLSTLKEEMYSLEELDFNKLTEQFASDPTVLAMLDQLKERLEAIKVEYGLVAEQIGKVSVATDNATQQSKDYSKMSKQVNYVADGFGSLATMVGAFSDSSEGAQAAAAVFSAAGAIAQIIASFAQSMSTDPTVKSSVWAWISAGLAGTAALVSMVAQIKSAGRYASGGVIGGFGNMQVGDRYLARLQAGEMVLNKTQQSRLFKMLDGQSTLQTNNQSTNTLSEVRIKGSDIYLALSNYSKTKPNGIRF